MRLNHVLGFVALFLVVSLLTLPDPADAAQSQRVLVVTTTAGFRHSSIPTAEKTLAQIAKDTGLLKIDYIRQPENEPRQPRPPRDATADQTAAFEVEMKKFREAKAAWNDQLRQVLQPLGPSSLRQYKAVIFANTTGDLPIPDMAGLISWVESGGAFIGMHSASDTFHGFPEFVEMFGGEFLTHKAQVTVDCINQDPNHPACKHLPAIWTIHDEIYILKNFHRDRVHGLLGLEAHPNDKTPGDYPIAWSKEFGRGKIFYTSLGHREDVWENKDYQKHILGGIKWAMGVE